MRKDVAVESFNRKPITIGDIIGTAETSEFQRRPAQNLPEGKAMIELSEKECAPVKDSRDVNE